MQSTLLKFFGVGIAAILVAGCHHTGSLSISDPHADPTPGLAWSTDSGEALAKARDSGQPVLLTFYSNNCGWCREFEKSTLADPKVQLAANRFVLIRLNVDEATEEAQKYNVPGVPYTVMLTPNGDQIGRVIGYVDAEAFLLKLREAYSGSVVQPNAKSAAE